MKYFTVILVLLLNVQTKAQISYESFFSNNSMRVDFVLGGNTNHEAIYFHNIKKEPFWAGSKTNLLDVFSYGEYKFELIDKKSQTLIFARGFCTLFEEWQTTTEASAVEKSFFQTITFPFPLSPIILIVYSRNWEGVFEKLAEYDIDPNNYFINPEYSVCDYLHILKNGDPAKKVDLVFLAEGYTQSELSKFESDAEKYGGGGFYIHYGISSVDHFLSNKVFIHEFGHSFAGLGDEYYTSSTSYSDFFNLEIEPWQPNLTTLIDFDTKWKKRIENKIPVPTPRDEKYKNKVGVYEGGGYVSKGMYSPHMDCRMKSNEADGFCPVCQDAIVKMILFKSE